MTLQSADLDDIARSYHKDVCVCQIFVELDELCTGTAPDDWEWRETARWIKYEEDVVAGADRWGRPHVAMLSFHSLLDLRTGLETGTSVILPTCLTLRALGPSQHLTLTAATVVIAS
ncbi:SLC4A3 [Cordylochernes scorpioides]|uniref:SLC4A3 n=1 Tax=Cordylochernes scorpioides TaxID=51811 RepID=A0ABY6KCD9_9ARAC|nr:SLC4A3 [Cordylochernes scorpioides]